MKQTLQLRLGQQITMTPQLQQAIRLLQLSTLELQVEVQQALETNIMLEAIDHEFEEEETPSENKENSPEITPSDGEENFNYNEEEPALEPLANIPDELAVDSNWEEVYETAPGQSNYNEEFEGKELMGQNDLAPSLQEHLRWQLELTPFSEVDKIIALTIIDSLDENGYLYASLEDILESLGEGHTIELDEVEMVLHRLQNFDPIGVAARNLSECLLIQLKQLDPETPYLRETRRLVSQYLDLLGDHDYAQLSKRLKLDKDQLREVIKLVQSLNPRPAAHLDNAQVPYVTPDVFVRKEKGQWRVDLNPDNLPKLRINSNYANLVPLAKTEQDNSMLKHHLQEARWFLKSLKSRHDTLLKVARCIVKRQIAFLEYGEEAMRPLVLHDIAEELEMHESTISRVTTQKYIHTPRGIFELKFFFSSCVGTQSGGECSAIAIRALIRKLIAAENVSKPLSDSKIAKILSERGINVARRTVAKYREAMVIPPSNERKRLG